MKTEMNEEEKVTWIVGNTLLNNHIFKEKEYDYWKEALWWAKSKDYFPTLNDEDLFLILRKYKVWNDFEKRYNNKQ